MLYDGTSCIGCQACVAACRKANNLDYEESRGLYDAPSDLSARTKNVIKSYNDGKTSSFVKVQCMHCIDPACVSACMLGAFKKREFGIVTWKPDVCIGCRYCQVACPFNVPKFEWDKSLPKIVKCELCNHLLAKGQIPACCSACPRGAIVFGNYKELLADAKERLARHPERYYPKVYGEKDGGGTQVLYLAPSDVPFQKLGLPELGEESVPSLPEMIQHGIYSGFLAPAALYTALGAMLWRNGNHKNGKKGADTSASANADNERPAEKQEPS